jgi:hypothetical protein
MKKLDIYYDDGREHVKGINPGVADFNFLGSGETAHRKCLPIKIAGSMGWDLIMPETFTVRWDGGNNKSSINILKPNNKEYYDFVTSSLGYGILTIRIPYTFEIEKDNFLWFKGPTNNPLSLDLYPMEGLVENDWFAAHITMNYRITSPDVDIILEKGKSYCRIVPYPKNYIEEFQPSYREMSYSESFAKRAMRYVFADKFNFRSKMHLKSYISGFTGEEFVDNIKRVNLNTPKQSNASKCPFHKLFKK